MKQIQLNSGALGWGRMAGATFGWSRKNGFQLLSLLFIITIILWRWELVWSSTVSLTLGAVLHLVPDTHLQQRPFPSMELLEYWVAALGLVVYGTFLIIGLSKSHRRTRLKTSTSFKEIPARGESSLGFRAGIWFVSGFLVVAVEAPLLAPFNPSSQGDLRTTRLMMPLAQGYIPANGRQAVLHSNNERRQDFIVRLYEDAYGKLQEHGEGGIALSPENFPPSVPASHIFILGTDNLGRDVLSRLLYALRISLIVGSAAMMLSLLLGSLIGFVSGFSRLRSIDEILMRITDLFLAVPALFLIIAIVAFFGNSTTLLILSLAGTGWMNVARMVRGEVLHLREKEFILAARMLGRTNRRIVLAHVIPNILPTLLVAAVLQLSNVILAEASLSFLGLGIQPPAPSLGNMIGESLAYAGRGWWVGVFPGLVLTVFMVSVNSVAESLQDRLEIGNGRHGDLS